MNDKIYSPIYKRRKWTLGNSYGWWKIPYCPHCKRQLGLMAEEEKPERCPMCNKLLKWEQKGGDE